MGCTSSAPSMGPAHATERNISFADEEEKPMDEIRKLDGGETQTQAIIENKVLPMCDNLDEPILSRTNKSMLETASQRIDKDVQTDSFRIDSENAWNESFRVLHEDKKEHSTPKLEEVVEKVVEMLSSDSNTESARNTPEEPTEAPEAPSETGAPAATETQEELEENVEHLEEVVSPSLSESSRATRWEALADIAAELPPSLAVDPLTGQIYSLSK